MSDPATIAKQLACTHGTPPNPPGFAFVKVRGESDRICYRCGVSEKKLEEMKKGIYA